MASIKNIKIGSSNYDIKSAGAMYNINFSSMTPEECFNLKTSNAGSYEILYGYMEIQSGTMASAPNDYILVPCETHIHLWEGGLRLYQTIKYYDYSISSSSGWNIQDGYIEYWRTNYGATSWNDWQLGVAPMVQAGDSNTPIYINGDGKPVACTSLDLNTTGNAATATHVAWTGVTDKPSYYDAKAIKSITRSGTTFTYTCLDGTTGTFTQQDNNTTYTAATTSADGLMSASDKTKLNGIPNVTTSDNGKFLRVVNGTWAASTVPNAEEATF